MTRTSRQPTNPEQTIIWRKSSHSGTGGSGSDCVEAGRFTDGSGRVAVRHSQHPDDAVIVYSKAEWEAFIAGAKDGEFDFG